MIRIVDLQKPYKYRETTVALGATPVQIAKEDFSRIAIRFQMATVDLVSPLIGQQGRISTKSNVSATSGFPVTFTLAQEFQFASWGPAVCSAWYGILAAGTPSITILELLYQPLED